MGLFRRKASRTFSNVLVSAGREPIWTPRDYASLTREGYEKCMTVFACVSEISRAVAGIPWTLTKRTGRGKPERLDDAAEHPLMRLLRRPNPDMGGARFAESVISYLYLSGNAYIERAGPVTRVAPPQELYSLRPDRVKVIPGTAQGIVGGYQYTLGYGDRPTIYKPEDVLHLKFFHPSNDWYGLSRIEVASRGIDISNAAERWNAKLLQNDMRPSGAFIVKKQLTDTERKTFNKDLREQYLGADNAGTPFVFEGEFEWQQLAVSARDMDWIKSDKVTTRKICSVMNTPPEIIGDAEQKTYSNYQEARKAFYLEAILPLVDWYRDELNNWLAPLYDPALRLDYDRNEIEALQEERSKTFERMATAWWTTLDEKREACGLPAMNTPESKLIYLPFSLVALGETVDRRVDSEGRVSRDEGQDPDEPEDPKDPDKPEGDDEDKTKARPAPRRKAYFWQAPERKQALWNNFVLRVKAKERGLQDDARAFLKAQAEELRARILKQTDLSRFKAEAIFDPANETRRYAKQLATRYLNLFQHAGAAGVAATKGELYAFEESKDAGFTLTALLKKTLSRMVTQAGLKINQTTLDDLAELIEAWNVEGATVKEAAQEIYDRYAGDFGWMRAKRIARTETGKVENFGQIEGYRQNEVLTKSWLCAFVELSRLEHMAADRQYSDNPIPLDTPFVVGGELLQYPGDPAGSPGNIVNCLCTSAPGVER